MINNCLGEMATDVSILFETKALKPLIEISQGKVGMKIRHTGTNNKLKPKHLIHGRSPWVASVPIRRAFHILVARKLEREQKIPRSRVWWGEGGNASRKPFDFVKCFLVFTLEFIRRLTTCHRVLKLIYFYLRGTRPALALQYPGCWEKSEEVLSVCHSVENGLKYYHQSAY